MASRGMRRSFEGSHDYGHAVPAEDCLVGDQHPHQLKAPTFRDSGLLICALVLRCITGLSDLGQMSRWDGMSGVRLNDKEKVRTLC